MYLQYWNLDRPPFECDFQPGFFFRSRSHQAALLKLRYLIENDKGAGLLVGETGSGKSCLTSYLASELESRFKLVNLHYPLLNSTELIAYLASELGADFPSELPVDRVLLAVKSELARHHEDGTHPIIVFDDAHLIEDTQVFQSIQLLLNFRHETPFTVLLIGQPSLLTRVSHVPALDQRLGTRSLLKPFSREETAAYIRHRLTIAGLQSDVFDPAAVEEIHELSAGLPRQINRIADLSLLVGYADKLPALEPHIIGSVAEEIGIAG